MGYVASYEALSRVDAGTFNVVLLTQRLFVGLVRLDGFDGGFTQLQGLVFFATFFVQMVGISIFSFAGDVKGDADENGNERRWVQRRKNKTNTALNLLFICIYLART